MIEKLITKSKTLKIIHYGGSKDNSSCRCNPSCNQAAALSYGRNILITKAKAGRADSKV